MFSVLPLRGRNPPPGTPSAIPCASTSNCRLPHGPAFTIAGRAMRRRNSNSAFKASSERRLVWLGILPCAPPQRGVFRFRSQKPKRHASDIRDGRRGPSRYRAAVSARFSAAHPLFMGHTLVEFAITVTPSPGMVIPSHENLLRTLSGRLSTARRLRQPVQAAFEGCPTL